MVFYAETHDYVKIIYNIVVSEIKYCRYFLSDWSKDAPHRIFAIALPFLTCLHNMLDIVNCKIYSVLSCHLCQFWVALLLKYCRWFSSDYIVMCFVFSDLVFLLTAVAECSVSSSCCPAHHIDTWTIHITWNKYYSTS